MTRQFDKKWYLTEWQVVEDNTTFNVTEFLTRIIVGENCVINLPLNPELETQLAIAVGGDWQLNNTTISGRGEKIMGLSGNLILDVNDPLGLVYQSKSRGYVFSKF